MTENQPEPTKPPYGPHPVEAWVKEQLAKDDPAGPQREPEIIENPVSLYSNPLIAHLADVFSKNISTAAAKNHDYAGNEDPLANFRECERFGVGMAEGIMVRLSDKWSRLVTLFNDSPEVVDESFLDTVEDMQVYLGILHYVLSRK